MSATDAEGFRPVATAVSPHAGGFLVAAESPLGSLVVRFENPASLLGEVHVFGDGPAEALPRFVPGRDELIFVTGGVASLASLAGGWRGECCREVHLAAALADHARGWFVATAGSALELRFVSRPVDVADEGLSADPAITLEGRHDTRELVMGRSDTDIWVVALFGTRELGVYLCDGTRVTFSTTHHLPFDAAGLSLRVDGTRAAIALRDQRGRLHFGTLGSRGRFRDRLHPLFRQDTVVVAHEVVWREDRHDVLALTDDGQVLAGAEGNEPVIDRVSAPAALLESRRSAYSFGAQVDHEGRARLKRFFRGHDGFVVRQTLDITPRDQRARALALQTRDALAALRREGRAGYRSRHASEGDPRSLGGLVPTRGPKVAIAVSPSGPDGLEMILAGAHWIDELGVMRGAVPQEASAQPSLLELLIALLPLKFGQSYERVQTWADGLLPPRLSGVRVLLARGEGDESRIVIRWHEAPTRQSLREVVDAFVAHILREPPGNTESA